MDRFDDDVRRRRQKTIDLMRAGDRFRFRPTVALELGPDAGKAGQRPVVVDREPDNVLLFGLRIRLRRVFSEAVERHQAAVFRLQPAAPVRRGGVADVGHRRPAGPRRWRHAPAHQDELAFGAGVAHDWRGIIRKHTWHRCKIADVPVHDPEEGGDRALIGRDRIKVTHRHRSFGNGYCVAASYHREYEREQVAIELRLSMRAADEEETYMPVLLLWAVP